ncbi:hypothetical protein CMI47_14345 [Candidatus Pacearchaeota archaeon]|nr:hypothetical protein [Candidatus Pacearchaeota archaeon]|tara:strand:+ start:131 stop:349 length:219 start_codon:yes stop_codon:yes gene_type:complete
MKVGDLVRVKPPSWQKTPLVEQDWIGIITDFKIDRSTTGTDDDCRYAMVFWNEQFPCEEEYLDQIEVISEAR